MSDPTRLAAFDLLQTVLERHRPLEEALDSLTGMEPRDRAAAHRLAAAVLRRMGSLDAILAGFMRKTPPPPVRIILRIGAAGLLLLETPAHAAVATAVNLARQRKLQPFANMVNAVLRRVAAAGPAALARIDGPRLDTPDWLWEAWGGNARAIAIAHQHEAALDLTLAPGAPAPPGGTELPTGSWRYPAGTRVADLAGYDEGRFWIQDAAAALPAKLLEAKPGEFVADLCAAPGGKTSQLAMSGAHVVAVERDPGRLARMRENFARLRLDVETVVADAAVWRPDTLLDAVLLDAPCSATGTIRRHPDVPHLKRPLDIPALTAGQDRLIAAAAALLRPGGRLVYSVCSMQPEEGTQRIKAALENLPLRPDRGELPPGWAELRAAPDSGFEVQTNPSMWSGQGGLDGFYMARLVKS